jgi:putative transposase
MDGSIQLLAHERNVLLKEVRRGSDPERRLRAHVLLLLDDGWSWNVIINVLFTSTTTINRWRQRYLAAGVAAVLTPSRSGQTRWQWWTVVVIQWVTLQSPRDFGFYHSRWTCGTVVALLGEDHGVRVSRETVRRWLHDEGAGLASASTCLGAEGPATFAKAAEDPGLAAAFAHQRNGRF